MKGKDIVCFANDWESDPTSKHQIMKLLSRHNRILWVNSIGMRTPSLTKSDLGRISGKIKSCVKGPVRVNDNLYHFTPIVLPFPSSPAARAVNKRILIASIRHVLKKFGMNNVQLWSFLPNVGEIVGRLGEELFIYYCVDEWSQFSFMDGSTIRKMEIDLLKKADLVIASSDRLFQEKKKYNRNTRLVTHGVDYSFFSRVLQNGIKLAADMEGIRRPIIGFFGLVHEWIDLKLLEQMAALRPDWSFVLIGKVAVNVDRFRKYDNVHFLGQKPYREILSYVKGFDLGMIPFVINELTLNVNPIKLREYLAAGLPVVSTPLPEVLKYADIVRFGQSAKDMITQVNSALSQDNEMERSERSARMNCETWEHKLEEISGLIESAYINRKESLRAASN